MMMKRTRVTTASKVRRRRRFTTKVCTNLSVLFIMATTTIDSTKHLVPIEVQSYLIPGPHRRRIISPIIGSKLIDLDL